MKVQMMNFEVTSLIKKKVLPFSSLFALKEKTPRVYFSPSR